MTKVTKLSLLRAALTATMPYLKKEPLFLTTKRRHLIPGYLTPSRKKPHSTAATECPATLACQRA
jgi:hypothetical protein